MRVRRTVAVAMVGAATVVALLPSAADASTADQLTSRIKAGYVVGGNPVHSVSARWVVPEVTCGSTPSRSLFELGLGNSTHAFAAGIGAGCQAGTATYFAWQGFGSKVHPLGESVHAGDVVGVTVRVKPREFELSVVNRTQGWGLGMGMFDGWPAHQQNRAWFLTRLVRDKSGARVPLADYGRASYQAARVNGTSLAELAGTQVTWVDARGTAIVTPSAVRPAGGFSLTEHAN